VPGARRHREPAERPRSPGRGGRASGLSRPHARAAAGRARLAELDGEPAATLRAARPHGPSRDAQPGPPFAAEGREPVITDPRAAALAKAVAAGDFEGIMHAPLNPQDAGPGKPILFVLPPVRSNPG